MFMRVVAGVAGVHPQGGAARRAGRLAKLKVEGWGAESRLGTYCSGFGLRFLRWANGTTGSSLIHLFNFFNAFNHLTAPLVGIDPIQQGVETL
jgi:hypothetical protein